MKFRIDAAIVATAFFQEAVIALARITTSYRALELDVSPLVFGIINAAYAVLPVFLAIVVGRFIDRGNEILVSRIGAAVIVAACIGFLAVPTVIGLTLFTAVLGISFLALTVGLQVICARVSSPAEFQRMIGSYLVANAVGQGVGSYVVAAIGGAAKLPATQPLYVAALVIAVLMFVSSWFLRSKPKERSEQTQHDHVSMGQILLIPRFKLLLTISVICVASSDLTLIYLPVLGAERGFSVEFVGLLLTIRSITTVLARFFFAKIHAILGGYALMVASAVTSAVSCALLVIALPAWALYVVIAVLGFALSVCQTVTLTSFIHLANDKIWGTVASIRMVGNRIGQFGFPVFASFVATASGVTTIFAAMALGLALSAGAVHLRRPR